MDFRDYFTNLALYNRWANRRLYDAVRALPEETYKADLKMFFKSIHGTLNHILVADRVWLCRFTGQGTAPQNLDDILYADFAQLETARQQEDERILALVRGFDAARFADIFAYRNMKGAALEDPYCMAFGHVFNHQTHHRGQVHSALSQVAAETPPQLDLIYFQRENIAKAA